jgi:sirohydrochlorin cobaltochelatase
MFGTRSRSLTAPVTERQRLDAAPRERALLLVAHGTAESSVAAEFHATRIAEQQLFSDVRIACLNGEPGLAEALAELAPIPVCVMPLLMAEGYSYAALRAQLATMSPDGLVSLNRALGANPRLADLMTRMGRAACRERGWDPKDSGLVIAAHGTPRAASSSMTAKTHARAIANSGAFADVRVAFLEEPPGLVEVLQALSPMPTVVVGFFFDHGSHGGGDVPKLIEASQIGAAYCGPIGGRPEITGLILNQARVPDLV